MFICGGHHDSDRIAVLVMVSKAESIVLYLSSCSIIMSGLDIDRWPDRFFHLLWPVGPVALAVHWPERASDRQFGPQGVCSALARNVNQI